MGKGDKRTRKGKINRGSYGKTRRPANRSQKTKLVPSAKPAEKQPAQGQPQGEQQAQG